MRRLLTLLVLALAAGLLFAPVASADHIADGGVDQVWTNDMNQESYWETLWGLDCTKFENHSGFIPSQYSAAVIKDGNMVRVYADLSNVGDFTALGAINPANGQHFGAPHSWVMKCSGTTTTTQDTTTTTTPTTSSSTTPTTSTVPSTTTTLPATTTTAPTTSSTLPTTLTAQWSASSECDAISADFGEGIAQINVFMLGGIPGVDDVGPIEVDPFLEPGTKQTGANAEFTLVPVVVNGYTAVPDEITLSTERCESPSSTISPTTIPDEGTLPFTGVDNGLLVGLGASALALGALLLFAVRREET